MKRKTVRRVSLVLALILCASLVTPSAGATPYAEDADGSAAPATTEETVPLVNNVQTPEPTAEPSEPPLTDESAGPEEGTETGGQQDDDPVQTELIQSDDNDMLDSADASFVVSYYAGDALLSQETVEKGAVPAAVPARDAQGTAIRAWKDAEGGYVSVSETAVTADVSYYAWYAPVLETAAHNRYVNGTGNARFSPSSSLTRAQAAQILYTLLRSHERGPFGSSFTDVPDGTWYTEAVRTLASCGVINGYADGTFKPTKSVTRAEFVTMLVNLTGVTGGSAPFTDVSGHWAASAIAAAAGKGWLSGYAQGDGTYAFRPQKGISRAEAVVVMNRVLGRSADMSTLSHGDGILHYLDVKATDWWYGDVMEASIGHSCQKNTGGETWTRYNVESCGLTNGLHMIGGTYYYVNANEQLQCFGTGLVSVEGRYFYTTTDGYAISAELGSPRGSVTFSDGSTQALADGFNRIGTTLIYWQADKNAPLKLSVGLNIIDGTGYWADAEGYVIRNNFGKGIVELGGKKYLSSGHCDIITSGEGYASASSLPRTIDLKNHTFEFDGNMYYIKDDYSLASDYWDGLLYFGSDCRYTSGDAQLDSYIWAIIKNIVTNNAITQEQKLLKAYNYIRGGEGAKKGPTDYSYRPVTVTYSTMLRRGRYNEQRIMPTVIQCAKEFYSRKYGICYQWGTAYMYLARRLGFQAYIVVGGLWSYNNDHCWSMIQWDGVWHISDLEIEWGHLSGYYPGGSVYRDLFDQAVSSQWISYYKNPSCDISYTFPS